MEILTRVQCSGDVFKMNVRTKERLDFREIMTQASALGKHSSLGFVQRRDGSEWITKVTVVR